MGNPRTIRSSEHQRIHVTKVETFDALHPSGTILFRSTRGGIMQGIQLTEDAATVFPTSAALAEAILLTGRVSHIKALLPIRDEHLAAGIQPSSNMPTRDDLAAAETKLRHH